MASWMLRAACLLNSSSVSLVFFGLFVDGCCFSAILIWASVMRLRASSSRSSTAIWSSPAPSSSGLGQGRPPRRAWVTTAIWAAVRP